MLKTKAKKMVMTMATGFLLFSSNVAYAADDSSGNNELPSAVSEKEGEMVLKYTAEEMDYDSATAEQKQTLAEQGWVLEEGVPVLYRSVPKTIEKFDAEENSHNDIHISMNGMEHNEHDSQGKHEETLIVNGEEVKIQNGTFEVKSEQDKVTIQNGEESQTVQKNEEGNYQYVTEMNLSGMIEEMDHRQEEMFGTFGYGDTYSPGDWVHCNRFNGPASNNKHLRKTNPQAYINFVGSDCDRGAIRYCRSHNSCNQKYRAAYCSYKLGHSTKYHKH